ncbi:MAG: acylneuraminate cytidylyltransferase family protein [Bdellovibrionota bacterium]
MTILLPIRAGSQRVVRKNVRKFSDFKFGLAELKIRQLICLDQVDEILIDTDLEEMDEILELLNSENLDLSRIRVEKRDEKFAGSDATTDDLISYLAPKVRTTDVLWTHTTQPFLGPAKIKEAINLYFDVQEKGFDSLMSVTSLKTFIWNEKGAVNYSREIEKWPRTQTLPNWVAINSGIFITSDQIMKSKMDRIGERPYLFELDKVEGWDIDEEDDFKIAESIANSLMKDSLFI